MTKEEKKQKAEEKKRLKEEKKALAKAAKLERKKNTRVKSRIIIYIFRAVFVIVMLAFVALGVYYVLNFENTNSVKRNMKAYRTELQNEATERAEVEAFANAFVSTYYNYNPEDETGRRDIELQKFLAEDVSLETPFSNRSSVVSATVTRSYKKDNGYEVHIRLNVAQELKYAEDETAEAEEAGGTAEVDEETGVITVNIDCNYIVAVPVVVGNGSMAVQGLPTYIADKNVAKTLETLNMSGEKVSDAENKDIEELAANFLTAYCGSKKDDLKYFVTDAFDEETLNDAVTFDEVEEVTAANDGGEYKALVRYTVTSPVGSETQELVLNLVKKDKFYVDSVSTIWW